LGVKKIKPLILLVDDNKDILFNLKIRLEANDYEIVTAQNGLIALDILQSLKKIPDLIISDIMMPEMNGYDFFNKVSENPLWGMIPFIFLSAKDSPKDVRFGKMLGVDDYLTKPFDKDDLLAIIGGKIARKKSFNTLNKSFNDLFSTLNLELKPSIIEKEIRSIILFVVFWDDKIGPNLVNSFYKEKYSFSIEKVGFQLFNAVSTIYGHDKIDQQQGVLINIDNIKRWGYIYFDSIHDETARGKQKPYMLGLIAPNISYFESLKIREIFNSLSEKIKVNQMENLEQYWEKISDILRSSLF